MLFPWPIGDDDVVLDDALDIAMRYLSQTGQADDYTNVFSTARKRIRAVSPRRLAWDFLNQRRNYFLASGFVMKTGG